MAENAGRRTAPTETSKSDAPKPKPHEDEKPQFYVWLENGDVHLVDEEDLPGASGVGNPHGHWQIGNKVHTIVAIHPKETEIKESAK